jgi:DNA-binding NtrC family response regulator
MPRILICDDEEGILRYLSKLLKTQGYAVEAFSSGTALLARLQAPALEPADLLLQDVRLPDINGIEILKQAHQLRPNMPVVVMTAHGTVDDAVHAIRLGAYDYVMKPFPKEKILGVLAKALEHHRLADENRRLREELQRGGNDSSIVFSSPRFREVYDLTLQVASSEANILILGESGTGKELIARTVHTNSSRRERPFISLNCAALSDTCWKASSLVTCGAPLPARS